MKKLLLEAMFLALLLIVPTQAVAGVDVGISISLPVPIVFVSPPELVVIPETYVYAVPDVAAEIYFYNGWWWRPWEGHWYRSRRYDSGWSYYQWVPSFYVGIPTGWRNDYREHRWHGHQWDYQRIPHQQLQRNWRNWERNNHWEKQQTWGVQGLKTRTQSPQPPPSVRPGTQVKPQFHEAVKQQQSRPLRETQKNHEHRLQPQTATPQTDKAAGQHQPQSHPGAVPQQHIQPQHREAPQQPHSQQGKPERGGEEKHERK